MSPRPPGRGRPPAAPRRDRRTKKPPGKGLNRQGRTRAFIMFVLIAGAFTTICVRLAFIQGPDAAGYLADGGSEWEQTVALPGERGAILDRNGYELAMSIPQTTIYADPHQVDDPLSEATQLAPILGISEATLQNELTEPTGFVYLARTIPDAEASQVAKLDLAGIYSLQEPKRFYPAGQLAQPLLGSVGTEGNGLNALEYEYNSVLSGTPGKSIQEIDPQGNQVPGGLQQYTAPDMGQDLVLSLDEPLQYQAEQALAETIVNSHAQSGIALLMDTKTGEILADANLTMPGPGNTEPPAVPINIPAPPGSRTRVQPQPVEASSASAFTQVYEPGSVNKLITISAALQTGVLQPSDVFTIPDSYEVAGTTFHDAESHGTLQWAVPSILANSSNIGTIQIAQRLGQTNLLNYVHDYGLGSVTDVNFPGESAGLLPTYWSGTTTADMAIGQGIAVTAVQMLAAYNTIANGGVYVPPRLVDATINSKGQEHVLPMAPQHRVVSETVASEMTTMLDDVVSVGTGTAASLSPYVVAGKTGTALVPSPSGGYEAGHYVASFAGFVPSAAPQITAMVVVNDTPDYGAQASAPTFATIARDALEDLNIPPMPKEPPAPGVPPAVALTSAVIPTVPWPDGPAPATPALAAVVNRAERVSRSRSSPDLV